MARSFFAAVAAAALAVAAAQRPQGNPLSVSVSANGGFSVNTPLLTLQGGEVGVQINGKWMSSATGGLTLSDAPETFTGSDAWGSYNATALSYTATGVGPALYAIFRTYADIPAIVFEQYFPSTITTGSAGVPSRDGLASAFPTFTLPTGPAQVGFMQYGGAFIDNGSEGPNFGPFNTSAPFFSGLKGGPVVLFDAAANNSLVFSAASNFMATSTINNGAGGMAAGIFGSVATIPAMTTTTTVLLWGPGPNAAMSMWGAALLDKYGKSHDGHRTDYTNNFLGYNTDHGAYYYYLTEQGKNYQQTLMDVAAYAQSEGIPYKHVLLDSWWYFKGVGDGVKNWTAMPSVFPDGNEGIRELLTSVGWKTIAHNRYWARDTDYATANGGKWDFYVDAPKSPSGGQMAVPLEQGFWDFLLQSSVDTFGLTTYEQDWLFNLIEGVDLLTTNITAARTWLLQMGKAAESAGVTIQYCMPYPRHMLQSVEIPAVTQARVSDDHVPCEGYLPMQWRIGFSSLLAYSLGVMPFKDNYWSTSHQPGGSCGNSNETAPGLHGAISLYSLGPVTPGDGVGYSDVAQIMRTCRADGKLIKPSRAATPLDGTFASRAKLPGATGPAGEVYGTYSFVAGQVFDHFLAAALNDSYTITTADVAPIRADLPLRSWARGVSRSALSANGTSMVAYSVDTATMAVSSLTVQPFDAQHGIALPPVGETDFQLWHTAPVASNGWALLGELSKWVPVSADRVTDIHAMGADFAVAFVGQPGETVPLSFWFAPNATSTTVTCTVKADGTGSAVMPYGLCA